MKSKYCLNTALFLILLNFSIFGENQKFVNLIKILYQQGQLADQITLFFDNKLASIYDPEAKLVNYKKAVSFFLPLVIINDNDCKKMVDIINNTKRQGYKISIESVNKPLKGLKIYIGYDPRLINWEYNKLEQNGSKFVFKFYNKKNLDLINQKSSPLRWYAYAHHNPRIVLDHDINALKSKIILTFKDLLEKNGVEVCLIKNNNLPTISHDFAASYANIIARPDIYIYLADKIKNERLSIDRNNLNQKIMFLDQSAKLKLNEINRHLDTKNKQLQFCLMKHLKAKTGRSLLGFEMPSISIYINEYLKNNLAQNLTSGIIRYFENQSYAMNISNINRGVKFSIN